MSVLEIIQKKDILRDTLIHIAETSNDDESRFQAQEALESIGEWKPLKTTKDEQIKEGAE
jgi:hypothetical protein